MTPWAVVLVRLVVALGLLVVVPLGLRLIDDPHLGFVRRRRASSGAGVGVRSWWWLAAVPGAVAPWLPRGPLSVGLAAVYAAATLVLAGVAAARLLRVRSLAPAEIAVLTALATPSVGGVALVAERAGYPLFGFTPEILFLTVPHLHFAGFTAALVAGLVCAARDGVAARAAALTVPLGTVLVLAGYFVDDLVELAGAVVLTAGMWAVGGLTWRHLRPGAPDRLTRALLGVSAVVLVATMLLALSWAVGEAFDVPHLSLSWMVATHGVANALGFGLCSVLAWTRLRASTGSGPIRAT